MQILKWLLSVAQDKWLHFFIGESVFLASFLTTEKVPQVRNLVDMIPVDLSTFVLSLIIANALTALAAFGKERLDKYLNDKKIAAGEIPTHGVEKADAIATMSGGWYLTVAFILYTL